MNLSKRVPYRNAAILKSAKGEECTLQSPVCNHDRDTVVFCHLNEDFAGKGTSQKADDFAGFYGCSSCHDLYDVRRQGGGMIWDDSKDFYILRAMTKTIRRLLDKGVIK